MVLPTMPRAPQAWAKVEATVQQVERRIIAPTDNSACFSLDEFRGEVAALLAARNDRALQKTAGRRCSRFEELDCPALKPLPNQRYMCRVAQGSCQHLNVRLAN